MSNQADIREEIHFELEQLRQVADLASELSSVLPEQRRPWDVAAAAKIVADFSVGFENMCRRRYRYLGKPLPEGPDSHSVMLNDFVAVHGPGSSLAPELKERLRKYLRFRHRFVHSYGLRMRWEIVDEPLRLLPDTVSQLSKVWEAWLESLSPEQGGGQL